MIRSTIRTMGHLALAVLLLTAVLNIGLGHHLLGKIDAVSDAVVATSELQRLTRRILSTLAHPRATEPELGPSLFGPLDAEVSAVSPPEAPAPELAGEHTQIAVLWSEMVADWGRVKAAYAAMREGGRPLNGATLAELDQLASELSAAIGSVHYLAARELERVHATLRYAAPLIGLVDLLVIGLLLLGLRRRVLAPLSRLAKAARAYSGEAYARQFDSGDPSEVGELSRVLDRSAAQISALLASARSNAELRAQTEQKFRALVEHAGVGVFLLQGGRFLYVNGRLAEYLATTPSNVDAGVQIGELIDSPDRSRVDALLEDCLRGGRPAVSFECRMRRLDGASLYCEVYASRTEFEGAPALIGTLIDHTERRKADAQVRKLLRAIEQSRATVLVTDTEGVIEYVNPRFVELTGYSEHEAIGNTPSMVKSGLTPPAVYDELWASLRAGREWSGQLLNRKRNGELFWEHMTVSAVRDSSGAITNFVAVKEDITERKRAEAELQRLNRTLRVLTAASQNLVHATERCALLQATCRNLVELGGYPLAYVAERSHTDTAGITVSAHATRSGAELPGAEAFDRAAGISAQAQRRGEPVVLRELAGWPEFAAADEAYRACIALPLALSGAPCAVLCICSAEAEAFGDDEQQLLRDLADDLAYGLGALRAREEHALAERALRDSEQRFRSISDSANDAIVMVDPQGSVTYWNAAAEQITGLARDRVVGAPAALGAVFDEAALPVLRSALAELGSARAPEQLGRTVELNMRAGDYGLIGVEASMSAVPLDGAWQLLVLARNTSARKAAEEAIRVRTRAIESSNNAIIIALADRGNDNPIIYANAAFERITGYPRNQALGRNPRFLLGSDWDQAGIERLRDALRHHQSTQVLLRNYRRDQRQFWAEVSVSPVLDEHGALSHYISVITDVTERIRFEEELRHRATHDQLTGLANRVLLADRIEQAVAHAGRSRRHVAVLLLDLDRFKYINDSLGHGAGDTVVRVISERLKTCVRRGDTVARVGGDEFVVVLAELAEPADASVVAQKIQEVLGYPVDLPDQQLFVTASIGITIAPGDGSAAETLLRNADAAMYASKEQGGSCFRFYLEEMNSRARQQLSLEADLRRAVDRGELVLHYQPKLDIRAARVVGAEALIRWLHPSRGMIPPLDFIPLAEETGMIVPIGEWALREACRQAKAWQEQIGGAISVAVNISARQFRHGGLPSTVAAVLAGTGLPAECLELELTESMIMQNAEATINALKELKALGIRLSIDDFGTGYSSLSYLRHFPVDTLKIDRSFVKDLNESENSQTVAGAIVVLAHGLGMTVVAEGVETMPQLAFLRDRECDQMQGYLFSRPLPAAEFERLYADASSGGVALCARLQAVPQGVVRIH